MADDETFYEVLSVDPDADLETIQRAYRQRVKEHHPDVSDAPGARERFKRITRAKEVLTDASKRARYDRLGHEAYLERVRSGRTAGTDDDRRQDEAARPGGSADSERAAGDASGATAGAGTTTNSYTEETTRGSSWEPRGGRWDQPSQTSGAQATEEPGEPTAGAAGGRPSADTPGGRGRPGRFAVREAAAAVAVGVAAAASIAVALGPPAPRLSAGILLASWVIVAAIAGRLAASSAPMLPNDVVRAHAFPLVLLVAAWYINLGTDYGLVAAGLAGYGGFAAVFRTAALVSGHGASAVRAACLWFVATVPAAVVVYVDQTEVPGVLSRVATTVTTSVPVSSGEAVLAVAAAVGVTLSHVLWRFTRALV